MSAAAPAAPAPTLVLAPDGWMRGAAHAPSPHHRPRPAGAAITLAVVHGISLPPGKFGGNAVHQLFMGQLDCAAHPYYARLRGRQLSAHFFVRRDGSATQFVSVNRRAHHAGDSHWRGRTNCNDFSVGLELEGTDDLPYEQAQYDSLAALIAATARRHPGLRVCGHCHIAPQRKTDPGAAFNWRRLFDKIGDDYDGRPA